MNAVDETVRIEEFCVKNFVRLGLTHYEGILAVENGYDWHEVEHLLKNGCSLKHALIILAK